jgi:hypothetical protein
MRPRDERSKPKHERGAEFLQDQLEALKELRADGLFSEIMFFARQGWRDSLNLRAGLDGEDAREHANQLAANYRELSRSLSH